MKSKIVLLVIFVITGVATWHIWEQGSGWAIVTGLASFACLIGIFKGPDKHVHAGTK
ncbi:MAG: hypothetical protein WC456_00095 [Patescibacteria group bacterium]